MRLPRPSMVIACLALFLALGGSAVAVNRVGSKQIKTGAVGSKQIKDKSIAVADIAPKAREALRGRRGAAGAPGPAGAAGPAGPQGPGGAQGPAGASAVPDGTVVVGAGGSPAQNGAALRSALADLPTATAADPRLVQLGPGRYDLEGTGAAVPADVTLKGAARDATVVESSATTGTAPALTLGARAGLLDLTVRNASTASGSTSVEGAADVVLADVRITGVVGVRLAGGEIRDTTIQASSTGIRLLAGGSATTFVLEDSRVRMVGPIGGRGLHASERFDVRDSVVSASSALGTADAVYTDADSGGSQITGSELTAASGASSRALVASDAGAATPVTRVDNSLLGGSVSLTAIGARITVGASRLSGGFAASGGGILQCAPSVYDLSYETVDCDVP